VLEGVELDVVVEDVVVEEEVVVGAVVVELVVELVVEELVVEEEIEEEVVGIAGQLLSTVETGAEVTTRLVSVTVKASVVVLKFERERTKVS
jgi:hypothetical protein